jgi:NitT/TauT family transport system substrate-binding protein
VPEIDVEALTENMMMGLALMKTEQYAKGGIGSIDDARMCHSVDLVNTYMGLPKKVDCKDVYTKDFYTKVEVPK